MDRRIGVAVGVVVAALAAIVLFGGTQPPRLSQPSVASTTSRPSAGSSPTSSSSSTSSSTSTSTTSTIPGDTGAVGFVPACVPLDAASSVPITTPDPPAMATLGPLGTQPALSITLPRFRYNPGEVPSGTGGAAERIPGGFLVSVAVGDPSTFSALYGQSMLMAINDDGTIRWRQCRTDGFAGGMYVARGDGVVPTQALIVVAQGPQTTNAVEFDHRVIDLADGRDEGTLHDRAVAAGLRANDIADVVRASDGRSVAFAGRNADFGEVGRVVISSDRIVAVDLATMSVTVVRPPRAALGRPVTDPWLGLTPQGELAIFDGSYDPATRRPVALRHDGKWLGEAAAGATLWSAGFPTQVVLREDQPPQAVLVGMDAHAATVWSRTDAVSQGESPASLTAGATTIAIICLVEVPATGCPTEGLVGLDTSSGVERWRVPGAFAIEFAADGFAMVTPVGQTTSGPWQLLDLRTGAPVGPDQQWSDPYAFITDHGGIGVGMDITRQHGGVVIGTHSGRISVWLPKSLSPSATGFVSAT